MAVVATLWGALLVVAPAQYEVPGLIQFQVLVDGQEHTERCRGFAYAKERPRELALDGSLGEPLRLAAGRYQVRVECRDAEGGVVSVVDNVVVRSGATTHQRLSLRRGNVVVQTLRDGGRVTAEVEVLEPRLEIVVAQGRSGNELRVPAGRYQVRVRFEQEGALPCQVTRAVQVAAGRTARLTLDLSDGTLVVNALRNGKAAAGLVTLFPPGSTERLTEFATGHEALVPPGAYDLVVSLESSYDFEGKRLRKVEVLPGKARRERVAFTMGTLHVDTRLYGETVPSRVYLYLPAATDYFNFTAANQDVDLSPGRYRLRAVLDDSVSYDAARPRELGMERTVTIRVGRNERLHLNFTPGVLRVDATKNGKPEVAALTVWTSSPRQKLTGGAAGEPMTIAAGRYDIDVLYPNGRGGDLEQLKDVVIESGSETRRLVNIERGTLTLDTFDRGSRVDAEVRFYKKSSKAPSVTVRGGEAAELAPEVYEIEIAHGNKSRWVSPMRVTAGSWEVRRVEF
ncbi:MAG: hypothetical protein ABIJ09_15710 [Pseudomonadota bacterium]